MPRLLPTLAFGVLACTATHAAETPAASDPWKTALAFDYAAAAERFSALHQASPDDTRVTIGYASALLVKQPRTESNIRDAHALLSGAASAGGEDAILATLLLARVELDHLDPAQPDAAREHLLRLRREHPAHPLADQAAIELAYLDAFAPGTDARAAIASVENILASVKSPAASRDLHQLLSSLHIRRLGKPAGALPHLLAARAVGFEQPLRNAETDLSIANIARETGDAALARKHYAAFLAAAPRDARSSTVRRILASL